MLLLTAGGPMVIMTNSESATSPVLLRALASKGIDKFIAYEIPYDVAKERYGRHFTTVEHDTHERDELRVLDFNGQRAFRLFKFAELGPPTRFEANAS
jgi:hypothetical protein